MIERPPERALFYEAPIPPMRPNTPSEVDGLVVDTKNLALSDRG